MRQSWRKRAARGMLSAVFLFVFVFGAPAPAAAMDGGVIYVRAGYGGLNDGTSWANAYHNLQTALASAPSGDQVWVAAGIYKPTTGADRTISFLLPNGVAVYGGFDGTETQWAERDWETNVTVLSGDIGVVGSASDNSYHVVLTANLDSSAVLDGFTITGGNANGSTGFGEGGGVYNFASSPAFRNLLIRNNTAGSGGGMANMPDASGAGIVPSHPFIQDVSFTDNTAATNGGGLFTVDSSPTVERVTFRGNEAGQAGGGANYYGDSDPQISDTAFLHNRARRGGGLYNGMDTDGDFTNVIFTGNYAVLSGGGMATELSYPSLHNVTFSGNAAGETGGGVDVFAGLPSMMDVVFVGNSAALEGGGIHVGMPGAASLTNATFTHNYAPLGGAAYNRTAYFNLTDATFTGNSAGSGGAVYNSSVDSTGLQQRPQFTRVRFINNLAQDDGGGIYNAGSSPSITDAVFSGNSAAFGGALYNMNASSPTVKNATFSNNTALNSGGAITGGADDNPTLTNVTFAGNTAGNDGGAIYNWGGRPEINNATFSGNTAANIGWAIANPNSGHPVITNSIFWENNPDPDTPDIDGSTTASVSRSILHGPCVGTCGVIVYADPKLGTLQDNGGFSPTMAVGQGSAAMNVVMTGNPSTCAPTDQRGVPRPQGWECDWGAYEVRASQFASMPAQDGWLLESGESTNVGGTVNARGATLRVGDDALRRQYRAILSFNTASIEDDATVVGLRLQVTRQAAVGVPASGLRNLTIDLKKGSFGSSSTLQPGDFQAAATTNAAGFLSMPFGAPLTSYSTDAALPGINLTGLTQFRLRYQKDDDNDDTADYLSLFSGNEVTPAYRPVLWVFYNP